MKSPRAVIAEDEGNLREELRETLAGVWPELAICAEAADGPQALKALGGGPAHPAKGGVGGAVLAELDVAGNEDLAAVKEQDGVIGLAGVAKESLELGDEFVGIGFGPGEVESGLAQGGSILPGAEVEPVAGASLEPKCEARAKGNAKEQVSWRG